MNHKWVNKIILTTTINAFQNEDQTLRRTTATYAHLFSEASSGVDAFQANISNVTKLFHGEPFKGTMEARLMGYRKLNY